MSFSFKVNTTTTIGSVCEKCKHGLAINRLSIKNSISYQFYNCRLKGSLSSYISNIQKCYQFEEYDTKESFMDYVKAYPKVKT